MIAKKPTSAPAWADPESFSSLLDKARQFAGEYIDSLGQRPVFPTEASLQALNSLNEPLPETSCDPAFVLKQLHEIGSPGAVNQTAGRYFGFVNGGMLPVGLAAKWLGDVWDQNTAHYVMSPIDSRLEEICERWIVSLLRLPDETAAGFVSGTTIANVSGLCAGRNELLRRRGWDVTKQGLYGAPCIRVIVGADAHAAVYKSISMLGLGSDNVQLVPSDDQGRMLPDQMPKLDEGALVIAQAGNVNSGAIELWAVLKTLGREGVQRLVEQLCENAREFARLLAEQDFQVHNDVVFNQVLVSCENDALTKATLNKVQASGECWCGGSSWRSKTVIRISVCDWATTQKEIERSVRAFIAARTAAVAEL